MNLCPCGARGDPAADCTCSAVQLERYRGRVSRALLDRFDLVLTLPKPRGTELGAAASEGSAAVRERVADARERLDDAPLELSLASCELLERAVDRLPLSGRGRAKVVRVSHTIAVLAGAQEVGTEHVAEALSYRSPVELAA